MINKMDDKKLNIMSPEEMENIYQFGELKKLKIQDIRAIKDRVKKIRVDIGNAPLGVNIFQFISNDNPNIYFESEPFMNEDFDALIYFANISSETAFIVLNSKQSLLNQIFAAAHEYYHYLEDYEKIRKNPLMCNLSELDDDQEKRASRFAAELLLPEEALRLEVENTELYMEKSLKNSTVELIAALCVNLSFKYQLPLKAVMFRLEEEKYIKNLKEIIENYGVVKNFYMKHANRRFHKAEELWNSENPYLVSNFYDSMSTVYNHGLVNYDEIVNDAVLLGLNPDGLMIDTDFDEDDDDDIDYLDLL